jgi:hypothetical protein
MIHIIMLMLSLRKLYECHLFITTARKKNIKVQHFNTRTKAENEPRLILTTTYKKRLEISKVVISSRNSKRYKRKGQEDKH